MEDLRINFIQSELERLDNFIQTLNTLINKSHENVRSKVDDKTITQDDELIQFMRKLSFNIDKMESSVFLLKELSN